MDRNNKYSIGEIKPYKWIFALMVIVLILASGFLFTVTEGRNVIVSRFGSIRSIEKEAGLHCKLPWPFEKVIVYDVRSQYMDSGYTETLTKDKINIILQTYLVWNIENPEKFYISTGSVSVARKHLDDLVSNVKNGVMGHYNLNSLVSTKDGDVCIDKISEEIEASVAESAIKNYGIKVSSLRIKRLALPETNVKSVMEQMSADRQKYVTKLLSEGVRDAEIITNAAAAQSAKIIAEGKLEAAKINADTEKQVAEIYGSSYKKSPELFRFLRKIMALENSVTKDTVLIMRSGDSAFDVLNSFDRK